LITLFISDTMLRGRQPPFTAAITPATRAPLRQLSLIY
jgi:hypothetical protein